MPEGYFTYSPADVIHYSILGHGPCQIVFLHGFAASLHTWDDLAPLFPADEFTLHLLDLKGHGRSSKQPGSDYSPLHNARLVAAYIRSRGLHDIAIIGHSLGGVVALFASLESPAVKRLVLIGSPAFPQKIPRFMNILKTPWIGPMLMTLIPARRIARKGLETCFLRHDRINEGHIRRYAVCYKGLTCARALADTVRQILPVNHGDMTARYSRILVPTLLLWGEHDRIVKTWQAEQLLREIPASLLTVVPECGHNPHEERPEETFAIIREFLSNGS